MSDEDYDQGFAEGYYQGLSTDKETSFLILAARIDELKKENEKLRAALKPFAGIAKHIPDDAMSGGRVFARVYDLRAAAAALKETGDE